MYILGINESHTATAALISNGKLIACASEERFSRIKLHIGLSVKSIDYCLKLAGIKIDDIDLVVFGTKNQTGPIWYREVTKTSLLGEVLKRINFLCSGFIVFIGQ